MCMASEDSDKLWHTPNGTSAFAAHMKKVKVLGIHESKAMILIIYCQMKAQVDLIHRFMRKGQFLFCSVHFVWSICFYVLTLLKRILELFEVTFGSMIVE